MSTLLNEAIKRFDVLAYVQNLGASQVQPDEWILTCPVCGKDKLSVRPSKKTFHCWVCEEYGAPNAQGHKQPIKGAGGVVALVAWAEGIDPREAAERVIAGATFQPEDIAQIKPADLVAGFLEVEARAKPIRPPENYHSIDGMLPYMLERGITLEDARIFGLGWCSDGRYANRLVFPVWENGHFVYFQARAMWREQPGERYIKALNPSKEDGAAVSSELLMNLDIAKTFPRVAIVEGPMDAIKTGPSAVCTFGKKISPTQIAKLIRAGVRSVDLMWDGPSAREPMGAWPEMLKAAPILSALFDTRLVFLPHDDPGAHDRAYLDWLRVNHARPALSLSRLATI